MKTQMTPDGSRTHVGLFIDYGTITRRSRQNHAAVADEVATFDTPMEHAVARTRQLRDPQHRRSHDRTARRRPHPEEPMTTARLSEGTPCSSLNGSSTQTPDRKLRKRGDGAGQAGHMHGDAAHRHPLDPVPSAHRQAVK